MKLIIRLLLVILAVLAWMHIWLPNDIVAKQSRAYQIAHPFLIAISFIFLHWLLRSTLMPLSHLSSQEAQQLVDGAAPYYSKRLFLGSITASYVLLFYHCIFRTMIPPEPDLTSLMAEAFVLMTVGTVVQTRGLITLLTVKGRHSAAESSLTSTAPASPLP